jgi:phospholipase/carboxylesterase
MKMRSEQVSGHRCLVWESSTSRSPQVLFIGLHGLGTSANDLVSLTEYLAIGSCCFVFPDAPFTAPHSGVRSYAWYDIEIESEVQQRFQIQQSCNYLMQIISYFQKMYAPITTTPNLPTILFGFSQGGVLALETGLRYDGFLSGIIVMSGYWPDPIRTQPAIKASQSLPILFLHGTEDLVIPVQGSQHACEQLVQVGFHPQLKTFNMGHEISEKSLQVAVDFLKQLKLSE